MIEIMTAGTKMGIDSHRKNALGINEKCLVST